MADADTCVICGETMPEGYGHVCRSCQQNCSEKYEGGITMEDRAKEIKHVTDNKVGPLDGVELDVNCVTTKFIPPKRGKNGAMKQSAHPAKILASYETGVVSISIKDKGEMVSVRLDEMMILLAEAANAKADQNSKKEDGSSEVKTDGKG